ncbi:PilZ domain-containing protein [Alteromonas sp. CYL-A6]|uniref:PilZ domain-containing protein n=1 Tax=Alteromonas nitratireducens TaxID=3390813 RepID=UPI0034C080FC
MDAMTLEQKQAQFDEFFLMAYRLNVNVKLLDEGTPLPASDQLESVMPYAFRIAGEMASIEAQALRPLRHLSDHAESLADYLNHQARKIDLMMSYILHQHDEETLRYQTVKFGGGGLIIQSTDAMDVGSMAEIRIFLDTEAAAIFCFGEVIACESAGNDYHIAFIFNRIREQDQELLVRASLHLQTQELRKRAQSRQTP